MLQRIAVSADAGSRSRPPAFPLAFDLAALAALTLPAASAAQRRAMNALCAGSTTSTKTKPGGIVTVAGSRRAGGTRPASQSGRGAGGGTDTTARYFAAMMEKELGQPVNVVNRTGGSGVVGHSAIAQAPADGYTIGMITVEISMMHWQGLTELNPTSYTPLALVNADPAGFTVRADSPYKSVREVLDYARANPGKLKASGTGQGGIWHLALAGLMNDTKLPATAIPWVPSNGAARNSFWGGRAGI